MAPRALQTDASDRPSSPMVAPGTTEAVRPPQADEVRSAGLVGREALLEFHEVSGVVFHSPESYPREEPASRGYPSGEIQSTPPMSSAKASRTS